MRLLEIDDQGGFSLAGPINKDVLEYAILSHTWGADGEEVTYEDMMNGTSEGKPGYNKIKFCVEQAYRDGLRYSWVDTCCIDKRSSAELSEAINSMFRWYQKATRCYVFLDDVPAEVYLTGDLSSFVNSKWFTRGWTLQELIAPASVSFHARDWTFIGTKANLCNIICQITRIPQLILEGKDVRRASNAKRMSWASNRQTTRAEDMAYCLLGIFDVHMPLLYGEGGNKAFIRLQEEILKKSLDQSLFAWGLRYDDPECIPLKQVGALAESPAAFRYASNVIPYHLSGVTPYSMTNKGLRLELPLLSTKGNHVYAVLRCHREGNIAHELALPLVSLGSNQYARLGSDILQRVADLALYGESDLNKVIYIDQYPRHMQGQNGVESETYYDQEYKFWIKKLPREKKYLYQLIDVHPHDFWDRDNNTFGRTDQYVRDKWKVMLLFKTRDTVPPRAFVVTVGFDRSFDRRDLISWCAAQKLSPLESLSDTLTNLKPAPAVATTSHEIPYGDLGNLRLRVKVFRERLIGENVHTIDINFI
jgi:Heterokaryon incompatibility protein (HET)